MILHSPKKPRKFIPNINISPSDNLRLGLSNIQDYEIYGVNLCLNKASAYQVFKQ